MTGDWLLVTGYWAKGIGHWALGKQEVWEGWEVWEDEEEIFPPTLPTLPTLPYPLISPAPQLPSPFPAQSPYSCGGFGRLMGLGVAVLGMGLEITGVSPPALPFLMGRGVSLPRLGGNGFLPPRGPPLNPGLRFLGKSAIASPFSTTKTSASRLAWKSQNFPTALVVSTPLNFNLKYLGLSVGLRGACLILTTKLLASKDWYTTSPRTEKPPSVISDEGIRGIVLSSEFSDKPSSGVSTSCDSESGSSSIIKFLARFSAPKLQQFGCAKYHFLVLYVDIPPTNVLCLSLSDS